MAFNNSDLMSLGRHCSVSLCRQVDFLPFTCNACNAVFCLDHRTYKSHNCPKASLNEKDVIVCPLCAKAVHLESGEDPNAAFEKHSLSSCDPSNYQRVHKKPKCPVHGCKEKLTTVNQYTCKTCHQIICLKHRMPLDHDCQSRKGTVLTENRSKENSSIVSAAAQHLGSLKESMKSFGLVRNVPNSNASANQSKVLQDPSNTVKGTAYRRGKPMSQANYPGSQLEQVPTTSTLSETCPQCSARFPDVQSLIRHAEAAHSISSSSLLERNQTSSTVSNPAFMSTSNTTNTSSQRPGDYNCPKCGLQFMDPVLLVSHSDRCNISASSASGVTTSSYYRKCTVS